LLVVREAEARCEISLLLERHGVLVILNINICWRSRMCVLYR
jgi:hypothetical protein